MQEELQEIERKYSIDWREYEIGELFNVQTTKKKFNAQDVEFGGKYRYVARGESNNGIRGYIDEDTQYLNDGNTISFGQDTATMFYQPESYFTGDKIKIFQPQKNVALNRQNAQFFITAMKRAFSTFSWGSSSYNVATLNSTKIILPTQNKKIAFDYIEEFIATLEAERLGMLDTYLIEENLKNCALAREEREALENIKNVKWGEFRNDELFDVYPSKAYTGLNDDKILVKNGKTPYVSNQSQNNGYIGWSNFEALNAENVITLSDTWQSERTIFYQPKAFIGKSHLQVMKPLMPEFEKHSAMFIISSFRKAILEMNYDYGTKFNREKIKATKIQLPIKSDFTPDFDFMATYIKAMQKVVIKNVVEWADKRIAKTKEVIQNKAIKQGD